MRHYEFRFTEDAVIKVGYINKQYVSIIGESDSFPFSSKFTAYDFSNIIRHDIAGMLMDLLEHSEDESGYVKVDFYKYWHQIISSSIRIFQAFLLAIEKSRVQESSGVYEVEIYIADKEVSVLTSEAITNACGELMEALGFSYKAEEEPIYKSFFQKLTFVIKRTITYDEIKTLFIKAKLALQFYKVDLGSERKTLLLANSVEKLMAALENCEQAVIRFENVVALKTKINGEPITLVSMLSDIELLHLRSNPELLKDPAELFNFLGRVQDVAPSTDAGSAAVA